MYNFYPYWKKNKPKVILSDKPLSDKDLRITVRFDDDPELYRDVLKLSSELSQAKTKVIKDILNDFFLDKENIDWQKEVESWK